MHLWCHYSTATAPLGTWQWPFLTSHHPPPHPLKVPSSASSEKMKVIVWLKSHLIQKSSCQYFQSIGFYIYLIFPNTTSADVKVATTPAPFVLKATPGLNLFPNNTVSATEVTSPELMFAAFNQLHCMACLTESWCLKIFVFTNWGKNAIFYLRNGWLPSVIGWVTRFYYTAWKRERRLYELRRLCI